MKNAQIPDLQTEGERILEDLSQTVERLKTITLALKNTKKESIINEGYKILNNCFDSFKDQGAQETFSPTVIEYSENQQTETQNKEGKVEIDFADDIVHKESILRGVLDYHIIDDQDTIGKRLFQKCHNTKIFKILTLVSLPINICGSLLYLLSLWNVIPRKYSYFSILILPFVLLSLCLVQVQILKQSIIQFKAIIINFWSIVLMVSLGYLVRGDEDFIGLALGLTILAIAFFEFSILDALPKELRKILIQKMLPGLLLNLVMVWLSLFYNWIKFTDDQNILFFNNIKISPSGMASSAIQNLVTFTFSYLILGWKNSDYMIFLSNRVELISMRKGYFQEIMELEKRMTVKPVTQKNSLKIVPVSNRRIVLETEKD